MVQANMRAGTVHCQERHRSRGSNGLERTSVIEMTLATIQLVLATIIFVAPLIVLAVAAIAVGVDSRPGIDDRGPHRWVPGG